MTDATPIALSAKDPLAGRLTAAIETGSVDELARLLEEHSGLANAQIAGRRGRWHTPLHVATHWPGYYPNGPAIVRLLLAAGADPNAPSAEGSSETPLHWAASTDDVDVAAVLIDAGADIEAPGASITGGSPLNNAVAYGCWHVARLLVERGAVVDSLWHAAALGMPERVEELLRLDRPPQEDIDEAFWQACHGGQLRMAQLLLASGANINASPDYGEGQTPLDIAGRMDERRARLVGWLNEHAALSAAPSTPGPEAPST
jgi:uncharacterized protein